MPAETKARQDFDKRKDKVDILGKIQLEREKIQWESPNLSKSSFLIGKRKKN